MNRSFSEPRPARDASNRKQMNQELRSLWKLRLVALGLGILTLLIVFAIALKFSNDLRLIYANGLILLFCGAAWLGWKKEDWFAGMLLIAPAGRNIQRRSPREHSGVMARSRSLVRRRRSRFSFCEGVSKTNRRRDRVRHTPERFRSFVERRRITMPLAFDVGGKAHDTLGLSGVPAIIVFDRCGKIRLTREGYNSAETSFRRDLVEFLKTL